MSGNTVKDNRRPTSGSSPFNAIQLMIDNSIGKLNTADLVKVVSVEAGGPGGAAGYVVVKPLVGQVNAKGETLEPVEMYKLPYFRAQCGGAAIVMDPPQPGDIGLANFTKRDGSNVKQGQGDTVPPASFRTHDPGNGVFMGTVLNKAPETFVEMEPEGKRVTVHAPEKAEVETKESTVNAENKAVTNTKEFEANASQTAKVAGGSSVLLDTPDTRVAGNLSVGGDKGNGDAEMDSLEVRRNLIVHQDAAIGGTLTVNGKIYCADIIVGGISFWPMSTAEFRAVDPAPARPNEG